MYRYQWRTYPSIISIFMDVAESYFKINPRLTTTPSNISTLTCRIRVRIRRDSIYIQCIPTKQNDLIRTQIISGQYQSIWQIIRRMGSTIESPVNSIINHTSDKSHIIAFIFPTLIGLPVPTTTIVRWSLTEYLFQDFLFTIQHQQLRAITYLKSTVFHQTTVSVQECDSHNSSNLLF